MDQDITKLAQNLGQYLYKSNWRLAIAESCTGGWVAKAITDIPGSSAWFEYGFVTYSNAAKHELLGVELEVLSNCSAVSEATVIQMAHGAIRNSHANIAVAISGIAGPGGGTPDKPVGTVWFAWVVAGSELVESRVLTSCVEFSGDRAAVRRKAVLKALSGLVELVPSVTLS